MEQWLSQGLSKILDFDVPEDLIKYVMSIETEADLNEYMKTLLDFNNAQHKIIFQEIMKRKFPKDVKLANPATKQQKKKISKNFHQQNFVSVESEAPADSEAPTDSEAKGKKKTKYVNLYSREGQDAQVVLLKGRHHCDCESRKHELINNCLDCGRIVCVQEGSGPCLFCGHLVCTPEEEQAISGNTKGGAELMESLMELSRPHGWEAALAQRNRLLEYERNSEQRTRVTDDDSDYFSTGSAWLSDSERERLAQYQRELHEKKHASRLHKKMTFDFAGRQIVEDKTIEHEVDLDKIRDITSGDQPRDVSDGDKYFQSNDIVDLSDDRDLAPGFNSNTLKFDKSLVTLKPSVPYQPQGKVPRVQDAGLLEMSDSGRCLSMHQPWASLLVEGIKLHEGRTWYTNHRGRLWIASTAKPSDQDVVKDIENQYREMYPDKDLKFPSFYPTGCLLGCVILTDCLAQEEYRVQYPAGESDSPYVFVCTNPVSLRMRFPITGQHKIYNLDKTIHLAAQRCVQNMSRMEAIEAKST